MTNKNFFIPWSGWELVEQIGRGQFGTVYKISSTKYGITEYAAMKVISIPNDPLVIENDLNYGYDKESVAAKYKSYLDDVLKEYQLMMKIKGSPNIVRCDDISVSAHEDGIGWDVYIRMELLTPFVKILSNFSNEENIIKLGMDICGALDVCEKNNIIHRDIKPSNILMSEQGVFKLGDFGVSRTLESENTYGTKGIGTYDYMSPEVYNGDKYGIETDIYSLGMVMYLLLNNRTLPFLTKGKAPTSQEISLARQKRFGGEILPEPLNGSEALKSIILKACSFNPKNRYNNAKAMLDELTKIKFAKSYNEKPNSVNAKETPVANNVIVESVNEEQHKASNTQNTWNDSQETVGKDYSYNGKNENNQKNEDQQTIGKKYSTDQNSTQETLFENDSHPEKESDEDFNDEIIDSDTSVKSDDKSNKYWASVGLVIVGMIVLSFIVIFLVKKNTVTFAEPTAKTTVTEQSEKTTVTEQSEKTTVTEPYEPKRDGDYIIFGRYEQDGDKSNGPEPIEWVILSEEDGRMLLVSRNILDHKPYHETKTDITWEKCSLRTWLNEDFINIAFNSSEQKQILTVINSNPDNTAFGTEGGNDTEDKVFLLSIHEAFSLFFDDKAGDVGSIWWLRSPGELPSIAAAAYPNGEPSDHGSFVDRDYGVRPALWLKLDSYSDDVSDLNDCYSEDTTTYIQEQLDGWWTQGGGLGSRTRNYYKFNVSEGYMERFIHDNADGSNTHDAYVDVNYEITPEGYIKVSIVGSDNGSYYLMDDSGVLTDRWDNNGYSGSGSLVRTEEFATMPYNTE